MPPPQPPKPPGRSLGDLAREWDLVGARGFAIAGGAVMALGIGFFFVLAANNGWIGAGERIALGAAASALVFGVGILLRARYGQYWSAVAAVGAGIAGAYATLAAAAARYDLVPDPLALPLAGAIAAVATAVALRWRSEVIAGIGLLGAALAPALQALDSELTWESAAFAVIVLVAAGAVCVPRDWRTLLAAASVLVGAQVEWLAAEPEATLEGGTVAVVAAFTLTLLGIAVGRQLLAKAGEVDPLALAYATAAFGLALVLAIQLFEDRTDRGVALLAASAVWAAVFTGLHVRRLPDLSFVVGASALALAAVGTADLVSDSALAIAWAAEAIVLAAVAQRFRDARLQALGIVYAALATWMALVSEGTPAALFDEEADHLAGLLPLAAAAAGALASGLLAPSSYVERTEAGLLAFLADLRRTLETYRAGLREGLVLWGAALATLAASFLLVSVSFDWGHVLASVLAAAVGALFLGAAGRFGSDPLAFAAFTWLAVVLVEAWGFDGDHLEGDDGSIGGLSLLAAAAGIVGGAYAYRILRRGGRAQDVILGVSAGVAWVTALAGVVWLDPDHEFQIGIGFLCVAAAYGGLSAGVFGRDGLRSTSTVLWSFALAALVLGELVLVEDPVAATVLVAATAVAVGWLGRVFVEVRLWLAASLLVLLTSFSALFVAEPWLVADELDLSEALAVGACCLAAFGLAALRWSEPRLRDARTVLWIDGILMLLLTERVLLADWPLTAFAVALTGAAIGALAEPLRESRLWYAGLAVVAGTTLATLATLTPPSHFFSASASPAESLWVLLACVVAFGALAVTAVEADLRVPLVVTTGVLALYAVSLAILELAERVSGASVETDFERGHTAVSALWALLGLGLLVAGLVRGSPWLRYGGLGLFGLSLMKIFLFDLAELSSVARAFSFILVGGLLLVGGFFLQRLGDRLGTRADTPADV
jgi:uncharacterized membrane protein